MKGHCISVSLLVVATSVLLGCEDQAFDGATNRGQIIYQTNCQGCHDDPSVNLRVKPPDLHGLYSRKSPPSGAPITDEQVRKTIQQGRGIMPPFGHVFSKEDLDDLIAYLHSK